VQKRAVCPECRRSWRRLIFIQALLPDDRSKHCSRGYAVGSADPKFRQQAQRSRSATAALNLKGRENQNGCDRALRDSVLASLPASFKRDLRRLLKSGAPSASVIAAPCTTPTIGPDIPDIISRRSYFIVNVK
jgi:hypothetical protein